MVYVSTRATVRHTKIRRFSPERVQLCTGNMSLLSVSRCVTNVVQVRRFGYDAFSCAQTFWEMSRSQNSSFIVHLWPNVACFIALILNLWVTGDWDVSSPTTFDSKLHLFIDPRPSTAVFSNLVLQNQTFAVCVDARYPRCTCSWCLLDRL